METFSPQRNPLKLSDVYIFFLFLLWSPRTHFASVNFLHHDRTVRDWTVSGETSLAFEVCCPFVMCAIRKGAGSQALAL